MQLQAKNKQSGEKPKKQSYLIMYEVQIMTVHKSESANKC